ncbi:hypothetical protein E2C01_044404 [Portunus trituberculatus]|uniref:Uncharacterized protein n=1 Tax=Portunus trituberculatus TaxID=210409 RepID=A0A5B7FZ52_PORTR|nr:hypothetical protein [Portunus trituberculatus]
MGRVLESIKATHLISHLKSQHLLGARQFSFRRVSSAAKLSLLKSNQWSNTLDQKRPMPVQAI